MKQLELPYQLKGPWDQALIMSYGVDFAFFENALWSQFANRCRRKLILLDGEQYLSSCKQHANDGLARHLNHRYMAAGVFKTHSVHAKLILLTNEESGRLLVGSGNLNWQGYASGGEQFCVYEYDEENTGELAAFVAVRELLDALIAERAIDLIAVRYVREFLESTPWIHLSPQSEWRPVRHNVGKTFLDQLVETLDGEAVEELWTLSPFYDPLAEGLRQLLSRFKPKTTHLLIQQERTSVDLAALAEVIGDQTERVLTHPVGKQEVSYLHSKTYLAKTANRAVCLQGSANLSQVAMLRTVDDGNVELCNLLEGPRDAFDYLLDELEIQDPVPLESLKVQLAIDESEDEPLLVAPFSLIGGDWNGTLLVLFCHGTSPPLSDIRLMIGDKEVPIESAKREGNRLTVKFNAQFHDLLQETVALSLLWASEDEGRSTNPVFVYNRAALNVEMQARVDGERFKGLESLDIDEDLELLVAELESALVIDRRSVWRLAGHRAATKSSTNEDFDAKPLSYDEIDYEALRRHPKTQQYLRRGTGGSSGERSRLQTILGMITGRFDEIVQALGAPAPAKPSGIESVIEEAETEEEREAEEAERQRNRQSKEQKLRQTFKRFIGRYLRGIESPDFREFVGFEVVTNNYIIFDHLLWELSLRDWFEPESSFLVESQLRAWKMFWGALDEPGYLGSLEQKHREVTLIWVREQKSDARLLAAIWYSAAVSASSGESVDYTSLRDFWRHLLLSTPIEFAQDVLLDVWMIAAQTYLVNPPHAIDIAKGLTSLANHESEVEFLRSIENEFGFPQGSCLLELGKFHGGRVQTSLIVNQSDGIALDVAQALLSCWMRYEQRNTYRISFRLASGEQRILLYDEQENSGILWDAAAGSEVEFGHVDTARWAWETALDAMQDIAGEIGKADLEFFRSRMAALDESESSHR